MNSRQLVMTPAISPNRKLFGFLALFRSLAQHNRLTAISAAARMPALVLRGHGRERLGGRMLGGQRGEAMNRQRWRQGRRPAGGGRRQAFGINQTSARRCAGVKCFLFSIRTRALGMKSVFIHVSCTLICPRGRRRVRRDAGAEA